MTKKPTKAIAPQKPTLPEPDKREKEAINNAHQTMLDRKPALRATINQSQDGNTVNPPHADAVGWTARILTAFGTDSRDFMSEAMVTLNKAITPNANALISEQAYNAALAVLDSMQPQNELEAMLITQMIATHKIAMQQLGFLNRAEHIHQAQNASNAANKLLRTYVAQMEALNKLRRGGEQHVRVEHVHVHEGGQAIVGNITQHKNAGGGGDDTKN